MDPAAINPQTVQHVVATRELYYLGGLVAVLFSIVSAFGGAWARRVQRDIEAAVEQSRQQSDQLTSELKGLGNLLNRFVTQTEVQKAVLETVQRDVRETKSIALEAKRAALAAHQRLDRLNAPPAHRLGPTPDRYED